MNSSTIDRLDLFSADFVARSTFYEQFYQSTEIKIHKDISGCGPLDCLIIPCSNGFGLKEGVPKEVISVVTAKVDKLVKTYILDNFSGIQPAGTCFFIALPEPTKTTSSLSPSTKLSNSSPASKALSMPEILNICWVCVARTTESLAKDHAFTAVWSALSSIRSHNKKTKEKKKRYNNVGCPALVFRKEDAGEACRQSSLAIRRILDPPQEPFDRETAAELEKSVIKPAIMTQQEREKELDGLLWSRELDSRGICNELELDILIKWVNEPFDTDTNKKGAHALAAAKAIVALLKRDDTEFTMKADLICERITKKDTGCLPRLLEFGLQSNQLELHREIPRSEVEIVGKIGDGNAGTVYKGKYKGHDVAVKMFSKGTVNNSQDFRRELAILSIIRHPLVLHCYGGSTKPGDEFIVTELMEASVYDLLHDEKFEMDMELKLDFAIMTARCMAFLHGAGLIHRDLKSLNLLVSKKFDVKIADFGLSRVIDSKAEMTKNIGTVAWIAPEIFAKRSYGEKADVYSYGVILWELLTRKMPFSDVESFSIPLIVSRGERPVIPKDCPSEWKRLIKAGWHQKPHKRPDFKTILQRLRKMVDTLREQRIAAGMDLNTERGLFLRNSSYITEDYSTGSDDQRTGSGSERKGKRDAGTSDEDYSESLLSSTSTSMSSSATTPQWTRDHK